MIAALFCPACVEFMTVIVFKSRVSLIESTRAVTLSMQSNISERGRAVNCILTNEQSVDPGERKHACLGACRTEVLSHVMVSLHACYHCSTP